MKTTGYRWSVALLMAGLGTLGCGGDAAPTQDIPEQDIDEDVNAAPCSPGERECAGATVFVCSPSSEWVLLEECGEGEACVSGACECIPQCEGRVCGPDGCGSFCGVCMVNGSDACSDDGQCCLPSCAGHDCGSDGCGGSCGTCAVGACVDGVCDCEPDCDGKDCGPDGCGGSCGECAGTCSDGHCCVSDCDGRLCGDDGCGGSCGECAGVAMECTEWGACVKRGPKLLAEVTGSSLDDGTFAGSGATIVDASAIGTGGPVIQLTSDVDASVLAVLDVPAEAVGIAVRLRLLSEEFKEFCGTSGYPDRFSVSAEGFEELIGVTDAFCAFEAGSCGPCPSPAICDEPCWVGQGCRWNAATQTCTPLDTCACGRFYSGLTPVNIDFDQGGVYATDWFTVRLPRALIGSEVATSTGFGVRAWQDTAFTTAVWLESVWALYEMDAAIPPLE